MFLFDRKATFSAIFVSSIFLFAWLVRYLGLTNQIFWLQAKTDFNPQTTLDLQQTNLAIQSLFKNPKSILFSLRTINNLMEI